jgi:hypothetical protein
MRQVGRQVPRDLMESTYQKERKFAILRWPGLSGIQMREGQVRLWMYLCWRQVVHRVVNRYS